MLINCGSHRLLWPGDTTYTSNGSAKQIGKLTIVKCGKGDKIERCRKQKLDFNIEVKISHVKLTIAIQAETVNSGRATLRRAEILTKKTLTEHLQFEIETYCGSHRDSFCRCCNNIQSVERIKRFLCDFVTRSATIAGLRIISVTYKIEHTA